MKIIALVSPKGGVGKSTVTANLAMALALREFRVLVVDMDPQNAQRLHLGLDASEIAGLVREGLGPESVFDSPFGVGFVPFGVADDAELEEFRQDLMRHPFWLRNALEAFNSLGTDFVLIDTPPGATAYLEQALNAAHHAIVVLQPDAASYLSLAAMNRLLAHHAANNPDFEGQHYLFNQLPMKSRLAHEVRTALMADVGDKVIPLSIHKDAAVAQALAFERPLLEHEPGSMAGLDFQYLADWVLDVVEP